MAKLFLLALITLTLNDVLATEKETLNVPYDVMDFIMGCQRSPSLSEKSAQVPFYETNLSPKTGTVSQSVSLLDVEQLEKSLMQSINNDKTVDYIIRTVTQGIAGSSQEKEFRSGCPVEKSVTVTVPPLDLDEFRERLGVILNQNNLERLEQLNVLLAYKFYTFQKTIEKSIKKRTEKVMDRLESLIKGLEDKGVIDPVLSDLENSLEDITEEYPATTESATMYPDMDEDDSEEVFIRAQQQMQEDLKNKFKNAANPLLKLGVPEEFLSEDLPTKLFKNDQNSDVKIEIEDNEPKSENLDNVPYTQDLNRRNNFPRRPIRRHPNLGLRFRPNYNSQTQNLKKTSETEDDFDKDSETKYSDDEKIDDDFDVGTHFANVPDSVIEDVNDNYRQSIVESLNQRTQNKRKQIFRKSFMRRRNNAAPSSN